MLTVGLAYFTVPPALRVFDRAVFGCPQTAELTVLTLARRAGPDHRARGGLRAVDGGARR